MMTVEEELGLGLPEDLSSPIRQAPTVEDALELDIPPLKSDEKLTDNILNQKVSVPKSMQEGVTDLTLDAMAAINKGALDLVNFPLEVFSSTSKALGGYETPTLKDLPFDLYEKGTTSDRAGYVKGQEYIVKAGEFTGASLGFVGLVRHLAKNLPAMQPKLESTWRGVLRDLTSLSLTSEAAIASGAGIGHKAAEDAGLGPIGQFFGALFGGTAAAAPKATLGYLSSKNPLSKSASEERVSNIIKSSVEDLDKSVTNLTEDTIKSTLGVDKRVATALETTQDMGLLTLQKNILAEDNIARGEYHKFFAEATEGLKEELSSVLGKNDRLTPGLMQSFLVANSKRVNALIDDRVQLVYNNIDNIIKLNRGKVNKDEISRKFKSELKRAERAVRAQESVLWSVVDKEVNVDTATLKDAAKAVIASARKADKLPKKELDLILKEFGDTENVNELLALKNLLNDNISIALTGEKKNSFQAKVLGDLNRAVMQSLEENPLYANNSMYKAAVSFTKKYYDTFRAGGINKVLSSRSSGSDVVYPEETLKFLIGSKGERQSAGARELTEVVAMAAKEKAGGGETYRTKALLQYPQEFLAGSFKTQVKTHGDAVDFLAENSGALKRFPELKKLLEKSTEELAKQEGRAARLEVKRSIAQKLAFERLFEVDGDAAIGILLRDKNPKAAAKRLKFLSRKNPEAQAGFRNSLADYIYKRSLTPSQIPNLNTMFSKPYLFEQVSKNEMKAILDVWYTPQEIKRLNKILDVVSAHNTSAQAVTRKVELGNVPLFEVLTRYSTVVMGSKVIPAGQNDAGHSLMRANILSGFGRWASKLLPVQNDRDLLRRAIFDEELLKQMLIKGNSPDFNSQFTAKIIGALAYEHPKLAESLKNELEGKNETEKARGL